MTKPAFAAVLGAAAACALAAHAGPAEPAAAPVAPLAPLKVAIPAPLGAEQAKKDAATLQKLLSDALHRPVIAEVQSAKVLPLSLAEGAVDAAWLSASQYLDAARASHNKVLPAAKLVRSGMPFYRSALFVKKTTKGTLLDLKGKHIAWVSQESAAGYLLARQLLVSNGFTEHDLRDEKFFGDHAAVCKAVLDGKAELGATFANDGRGGSLAGCSESVGDATKELKVIATSDPIPNDVFALKPGTPPEVVEQLRAALIGLSSRPEGKQQLTDLFHADAFVAAADDDFALLRQALK